MARRNKNSRVREDPTGNEKFKRVTRKEQGEVEALGAKRSSKGSAKEAAKKKGTLQNLELSGKKNLEERRTPKQENETGDLNFQDLSEKQRIHPLDLLSAVGGRPRETFTEGLSSGIQAVKEQREGIESGELDGKEELIKTSLTALAGPAIAATAAIISPFAAVATVWAIDNFLLSPSEITEWTAVDNIAGQTNFRVGEVKRRVMNGQTIGNEFEIMEQAQRDLDFAKNTVETITRVNPKTWAGSKAKFTAIQITQDNIDELRLLI